MGRVTAPVSALICTCNGIDSLRIEPYETQRRKERRKKKRRKERKKKMGVRMSSRDRH